MSEPSQVPSAGLPGWRSLRASFTFMTRLPLGGFPYLEEELRGAPAYFPLVGAVVGALAGGVFVLTSPLGSWIASALTIGFCVWLTGAFHEDGLADTADAMGGAHSQKKLLDILKDSRIGTYGGAALCLSLLLRVSLLAHLPVHALHDLQLGVTAPLALLLVHTLARTGPVILMATLPYVAGERSKGAAVAAGGQLSHVLIAISIALAMLGAMTLGGMSALLAALLAFGLVLSTWGFYRWFKERAGGFTGDFLGATEQALEILLLFIICSEAQLRVGAGHYHAWF